MRLRVGVIYCQKGLFAREMTLVGRVEMVCQFQKQSLLLRNGKETSRSTQKVIFPTPALVEVKGKYPNNVFARNYMT